MNKSEEEARKKAESEAFEKSEKIRKEKLDKHMKEKASEKLRDELEREKARFSNKPEHTVSKYVLSHRVLKIA